MKSMFLILSFTGESSLYCVLFGGHIRALWDWWLYTTKTQSGQETYKCSLQNLSGTRQNSKMKVPKVGDHVDLSCLISLFAFDSSSVPKSKQLADTSPSF